MLRPAQVDASFVRAHHLRLAFIFQFRERGPAMRRIAVVVLVLVSTLGAAGYAENTRTPQFTVAFRGSLDNAGSTQPLAINNRGEVVGFAFGSDESAVAFFWSRRDGFRRIAPDAFALDINDRGDVVGTWGPCIDECPQFGFMWNERDGFRDLGASFPARLTIAAT
jgi:hypothetical protein